MSMKAESRIRHPIVNGIFYPDDQHELRTLVRELGQQVKSEEITSNTPEEGELRVLLLPHASYQHIGSYLAGAFACIRRPDQIKRVVLISSVHRDNEDAVLLPDFTAYDCPLGATEVDTAAVRQLTETGYPFRIDNTAHTEEHAQEILLPMLREYCPDAKIVPILLGSYSKEMLDAAADELKKTAYADEPNTIWLLSSNLSSFTDSVNSQKEAEHFLEQLSHPSGRLLASRSSRACGRNGLYLLSRLFSEGIRYIKLRVGRSGIIQPEQREVWYGSFAGYTPAGEQIQGEEL